MKTITYFGALIGTAVAMAAAPALADGMADAKALVEKYSKLPAFEPPGSAFDAKACMAGKKIFVIPLTNANPFNVAISQGMEQAAKIVGIPIKTWATSRAVCRRNSSRRRLPKRARRGSRSRSPTTTTPRPRSRPISSTARRTPTMSPSAISSPPGRLRRPAGRSTPSFSAPTRSRRRRPSRTRSWVTSRRNAPTARPSTSIRR